MTTATAPPEPYADVDRDWAAPVPDQGDPGLFDDPERLAKLLGWFSIGLGLAQIASPRGMVRLTGVEDSTANLRAMRALGMREITTGVGILAQDRPAGWLWGRVAGDAMDLALLAGGRSSPRADRGRLAGAGIAVAGVLLLDAFAAQRVGRANGSALPGRRARHRGGIQVTETVTIGRPVEEVYRFWRDFTNLPRFMEHLESVELLGDRRSRWRAKAPAGSVVEWEAEIVEDRPGELISWRSTGDADVTNRGSVRFASAPDGESTEIHVDLRYEPPGGKLASMVAKLFGEEPGQQVRSDLRRLKQVLEVGEVIRSDASIHRFMHPARPSESAAPALPPGGIR